jgi:DNA-binding MarR family transcriptional regulator
MKRENNQLQESFGYLVGRTSKIIRKILNNELSRNGFNLTGEQFDILVELWNRDGQNQQQLAEKLYKDKSTMTRLIKNVEKLNLISRVKNQKDERQRLVYLTGSGVKMVKKILILTRRVISKAQNEIPASHLKACKDVLKQINEILSRELTG